MGHLVPILIPNPISMPLSEQIISVLITSHDLLITRCPCQSPGRCCHTESYRRASQPAGQRCNYDPVICRTINYSDSVATKPLVHLLLHLIIPSHPTEQSKNNDLPWYWFLLDLFSSSFSSACPLRMVLKTIIIIITVTACPPPPQSPVLNIARVTQMQKNE